MHSKSPYLSEFVQPLCPRASRATIFETRTSKRENTQNYDMGTKDLMLSGKEFHKRKTNK